MRGLSKDQLAMLGEIYETGPVRIMDLAASLGRTPSATRNAVKRLKKRGLVDHTEITYAGRHGLSWFSTDRGDAVALRSAGTW